MESWSEAMKETAENMAAPLSKCFAGLFHLVWFSSCSLPLLVSQRTKI